MFATGVAIVTTCTPQGQWVGLTVNSFNAVSLTPPLVLWSLGVQASTLEAFHNSTHYAINILGVEHQALALRFASRDPERFAGAGFIAGSHGAPVLSDAIARFECFNRSQYEEGDHVIFVGEVEQCSHREGASPLLFHGSKFYTEHPL